MKKLCIVTTTRADWGLLSPVADTLRHCGDIEVQIVAGNMHIMERYGLTRREIETDGYDIAGLLPVDTDGADDDASRVRAMSQCMAGCAEVFARVAPDAVLLLGDRYEMLAIAAAAATMHIPIIHIAGGEISEGALDDAFRHAITKLATLHLTATERYRERVMQLGEAPDRVVNTGAIGVWNAFNTPLMSRAELEHDLSIVFGDRRVAAVTFHPATNDTGESPQRQAKALTDALAAFPDLVQIITYPNNDAGGAAIIPVLEDYAAAHAANVRLVKSLGMKRYQSLIAEASVVIGNSSSGIVEAPSAGCVTVDIGIRQRGRMSADTVLHCAADTEAIRNTVERALGTDMQALAAKKLNPYYKPDTLELMRAAIVSFMDSLPCPVKKFYDLP